MIDNGGETTTITNITPQKKLDVKTELIYLILPCTTLLEFC